MRSHLRKLYYLNVSFERKVLIASVVSLFINFCFYYHVNNLTSRGDYAFTIDVIYPLDGSLQLFYDYGDGFHESNSVSRKVLEGFNTLELKFKVPKGERLKMLRVDFGDNQLIRNVTVNKISLKSRGKNVFRLDGRQTLNSLGFTNSVLNIDKKQEIIYLKTNVKHFDPYIKLTIIHPKILF